MSRYSRTLESGAEVMEISCDVCRYLINEEHVQADVFVGPTEDIFYTHPGCTPKVIELAAEYEEMANLLLQAEPEDFEYEPSV